MPIGYRPNTPISKYLQMINAVTQYRFALEGYFSIQYEFSTYSSQPFKCCYAMCHLYIVYYQFLNEFLYLFVICFALRYFSQWIRSLEEMARGLSNQRIAIVRLDVIFILKRRFTFILWISSRVWTDEISNDFWSSKTIKTETKLKHQQGNWNGYWSLSKQFQQFGTNKY